ncbi:MAG TPA: hypothetical protein VFF68_00745, partial [Anaerolineaceae bacterium]|nr:hypothetical protein [Anaerolineaceae bacterium]
MRAKLAPVYFSTSEDPDFQKQYQVLKTILADDAEILAPVALGQPLPPEADAVVFPQMLGDAFKRLDDMKAIDRPILVVTSEFGTVSMWDWEINNYLASEGVQVIAPYSLEQTQKVCRTLTLKKELPQTRFLVYQDNPGEGFQADIFKRFYWWEDESIQRIQEKFGITIEKRSFQRLGEEAKAIPDPEAEKVWAAWQARIPTTNLSTH